MSQYELAQGNHIIHESLTVNSHPLKWKPLNVLVTHDIPRPIGSNFLFSPLVAAATRALGPLYVAKQRQPKEGTFFCHPFSRCEGKMLNVKAFYQSCLVEN